MSRSVGATIVAVGIMAASIATVSCGASAADEHRLLNGITASVQPSYDLAVRMCDEHEGTILARPNTTAEEDRAAIMALRSTCDRAFGAFEAVRLAQGIARDAIDGGGDAALAAAISRLNDAWAALRAMAPEIERL